MIGSEQIVKSRVHAPKPAAEIIFTCHGDCGRMTRPSRMKLAEAEALGFKNTIPRHSKTMCRTDFIKHDPPKHRTVVRTEPPAHKTEATLSALDRFMQDRRARQAKRGKV